MEDLQANCAGVGACTLEDSTGDMCWENGVAFSRVIDSSQVLSGIVGVDMTWTTETGATCYTVVGSSSDTGTTFDYEWYAADGTTLVATGFLDSSDSTQMDVTCVGESTVTVDFDAPACSGSDNGTDPDSSGCTSGTCQ